MTVYLSDEQLLALYSVLIRVFGGRPGLRDRGALEAAAARPAMTFGGDDLYPDLAAKGAALMHSLLLNHPLLDGNKRLGAAAAELFLRVNGAVLDAGDEEFEAIALATAAGDVEPEALTIWCRQRIRGPQRVLTLVATGVEVLGQEARGREPDDRGTHEPSVHPDRDALLTPERASAYMALAAGFLSNSGALTCREGGLSLRVPAS